MSEDTEFVYDGKWRDSLQKPEYYPWVQLNLEFMSNQIAMNKLYSVGHLELLGAIIDLCPRREIDGAFAVKMEYRKNVAVHCAYKQDSHMREHLQDLVEVGFLIPSKPRGFYKLNEENVKLVKEL